MTAKEFKKLEDTVQKMFRTWEIYSVKEVFLIIDPMILTEHPAKGFDATRAKYGSGRYYEHQCALTDPPKEETT